MVASKHIGPVHLLRCMTTLLASALSAITLSQIAQGTENAEAKLPPAVEKIMHWFPEDTETIVVGQSFKIDVAKHDNPRDRWELPWTYIQNLSLGDLPSLAEGGGLKQLVGRGVAVGINGGRDFEVVSKFGSQRYQGCSVLRFKEPLPEAGRELTDALRGEAKEVRKVAGTDVFVFPDRTVMEALYKPKAWQGQFIALPAADTLLSATSDEFLREVLERLAAPAAVKRALPPELPEWKHVDTAAPAWALRHIRKKVPGQSVVGLTWCLRPQGREVFEVTYLRTEGADARPITDLWNKPEVEAHPSIEQNADGTTVVAADIQKEKLGFWYPMAIYWSMGETGESIK